MGRASCGCDEGTAGVIHKMGCSHFGKPMPLVGHVSPAPGTGEPIGEGQTFTLINSPPLDPWTMGTLHSLVVAEIRFGDRGEANYHPVSTEGAVRKVLARFAGMPIQSGLEAELVLRVNEELGRPF